MFNTEENREKIFKTTNEGFGGVIGGDIKPSHSFGWALKQLQNGAKLRRNGWNGKGQYIELQKPDTNSKRNSLDE